VEDKRKGRIVTAPRETNTPLDPGLARWLEPLRELNPSASEIAPDDAHQLRRAEHIQRLSAMIRSVPAVQTQTRRKSQWLWGIAAAAAMLVAAGGTLLAQAQQPAVAVQEADSSEGANLRQLWGQVVARRHGGQTEVLRAGSAIGTGDELSTTAEGYASLDVGRVRVDLSSATTMELMRTETRNQAYQLRAGRVDVSVPHVPSEKQQLEVITPNATVHVRGTVFSVEVDNHSGAPVTRVQVTRGSVGVDHNGAQHVVDAGQSWSSLNSTVGDVAVAEPDDRAEGLPSETNNAGAAPRGQSAERSSLREQNQLYARALQAQRRGNHRLAAQLFSALIRKYPDSPLGPSAQSELEHARTEMQNQ
jgi:hypothetical protein